MQLLNRFTRRRLMSSARCTCAGKFTQSAQA